MLFITNIHKSPVVAELVALAAKYSGLNVTYLDRPATRDECWKGDPDLDHYTPPPDCGSIWTDEPDQRDHSVFWDEFDRLEELVKEPLNEPILADDYPVYQGYLYVVDGKVREFIDGMNQTVGDWKRMVVSGVAPVTEVRRCDIAGRRLRLPEKRSSPENPVILSAFERLPHKQKYRRRRNSHKIKKVRET